MTFGPLKTKAVTFSCNFYWNLSHLYLTPSKPTLIQMHIHPSALCTCSRAGLDILAPVGDGTWSAVRGVGPTPLSKRLSWVELREGDRKKGKRKADKKRRRKKKVAIWIDRPQGHMVESQTGWCSAALCLCCQPQKLTSLRWSGCGWEPTESGSNFKVWFILACLKKTYYYFITVDVEKKHIQIIWHLINKFTFL